MEKLEILLLRRLCFLYLLYLAIPSADYLFYCLFATVLLSYSPLMSLLTLSLPW